MIKISLAQINPIVGGIDANVSKMLDYAASACEQSQADVVVFPELSITGYPPEDLLFRNGLLRWVEQGVDRLLKELPNQVYAIVGLPEKIDGQLYNAAYVLHDGDIIHRYYKQKLPNYAVFDEDRYFEPGENTVGTFSVNDTKVAVTICEDIWFTEPALQAKQADADLIINLNASPFHHFKHEQRIQTLQQRVAECGLPIIYVNQVGGQDELIFDGRSLICDSQQQIIWQASPFVELQEVIEFPFTTKEISSEPMDTSLGDCYQALVMGVTDYVRKNGFKGALLGLSGGIDSALTLAIAVDALGAENVNAVMMPTRYTADMSQEDAGLEATALGIEYDVIPIEPIFEQFLESLSDKFAGLPRDTTEENLQARSRGVILMALSNKTGRMLLTTGNKSEMAVGYATLYGDMAGGFAPLKDVSKMMVYELAKYRNTLSLVIPERVIDRAPSAELSEDQKDSDSLPPYPVLDDILERFVEQDQSVSTIVAAGHDRDVVVRVARMVMRNEYKRRQAPPGVRITPRGFGKDRRYPITSGYPSIWNR